MLARFGSYEILHELRTGGMGSVLLARRRGPGNFEQLVAIKTIRREYATTEAVRAMFLDEAAILARINHPGIASVHDFGEEAGTLYMAMEYVSGVSFRALVDSHPPPVVIARAIAEACRGLHAAHEVRDITGALLGVVHRDISPDNLMLGYDGHVKVIDFGIALVKNRQSPVTELGTLKGKPPYMSPEQVKNEPLDRRSDVFSLGVVAHELLTGQPLFDGDSIYAVAYAVEHQPIVPPSQVLGTPLPAGLDAAILAALERDPDRRTPTAAAFAEQLEQVIARAGGETLEAWAERELAGPRDAQRTWLAKLVTSLGTPAPLGRPTGAVTQVAPLAPPEPPEAPAAVADEGQRSPRRRALPVAVGVVALLALGGGAVYLTRAPATAPIDAAVVGTIDAPLADATRSDTPPDATIEAALDASLEIAIDAAPPSDARVVVDAGRRLVVDAGARGIAVDAAPPVDAAAVARGTGQLVVKHHAGSSSYLEVYVDGALFGKTPILRPRALAAGRHEVKLVVPNTGAVVHVQTITVGDGETLTVVEPTPH